MVTSIKIIMLLVRSSELDTVMLNALMMLNLSMDKQTYKTGTQQQVLERTALAVLKWIFGKPILSHQPTHFIHAMAQVNKPAKAQQNAEMTLIVIQEFVIKTVVI